MPDRRLRNTDVAAGTTPDAETIFSINQKVTYIGVRRLNALLWALHLKGTFRV